MHHACDQKTYAIYISNLAWDELVLVSKVVVDELINFHFGVFLSMHQNDTFYDMLGSCWIRLVVVVVLEGIISVEKGIVICVGGGRELNWCMVVTRNLEWCDEMLWKVREKDRGMFWFGNKEIYS